MNLSNSISEHFRKVIPTDENIVRAIQIAHWDARKNRCSSDLFYGENISVSRLSILPFDKICKIFVAQIPKPGKPNSIIKKVGEINVGVLQQVSKQVIAEGCLTVVEDPTLTNPAHAEIIEPISRLLANKIVTALILRDVP